MSYKMFWTKKNSRVYYCAWLLLIMLLERAKTQDIPDRCILNFTVQPVTSVDCNVYETDLEVLTCTVELLSTADVADPQDILIKWFFFNDTEYEVAVGVNPPQGTGGNGGHVTVTSTLHISGTSQPNASYVSEGFYYCQVQITDRSVQSKPSQKFEVFNRDQHLQASSSCSERTFTAPLQSCAVYRIREDTPTTTGPISVHYTSTDSAMPCSTERDTTTPPVWTEGQSTPPLITRTEGSERPLERIWIYVLASLAGAFAIIILILVVSFVLICRFRIATNVEDPHIYETVSNRTKKKKSVIIKGSATHDQCSITDAKNVDNEICAATAYELSGNESVLIEKNPAYAIPVKYSKNNYCI